METPWLVSYIALWFFVALEGLVLLALARQIGFLHVRLGPAGARMMNPGLQIGDPAPPLAMYDIFGRHVTLGVARGKRTLLVFVSSRCPACKELMPGLRALHRTENSLEIVLISSEADVEASRKVVRDNRLSPIPFVTSNDLSIRYQVGMTPYAVLVDQEGKVRAKGLVNNLPHLESLLNAEELGHPSIESFLGQREQQFVGPEIASEGTRAQ